MMRHYIFVLLTALAIPSARADDTDTLSFYWDRYAVRMSDHVVPQDSITSPAYRSRFATLSLAEASKPEALALLSAKKSSDSAATKRDSASTCGCAHDH